MKRGPSYALRAMADGPVWEAETRAFHRNGSQFGQIPSGCIAVKTYAVTDHSTMIRRPPYHQPPALRSRTTNCPGHPGMGAGTARKADARAFSMNGSRSGQIPNGCIAGLCVAVPACRGMGSICNERRASKTALPGNPRRGKAGRRPNSVDFLYRWPYIYGCCNSR